MRTVHWLVLALALALASPVGAVTRYWNLQDVAFDDGTTVTGSFGYDDVTDEVSNWSVRVKAGANYLPFNYMPGNSIAYTVDAGTWAPVPTFVLVSQDGGLNPVAERTLRITPVTVLDGTPSTVAVDTATAAGGSGGMECYNCGLSRRIVSGSFVMTPLPPPIAIIPVVEFYSVTFNHYVMSADPVEINALDTGYFAGWARTGYEFNAYPTGASAGGSINPVCRYYGLPSAGLSSHFFSASARDCFLVHELFPTDWQIESDNVFQINLPDTATGACPTGTIPVYRLFNGKHDANHRYTTSMVVRSTMIGLGWIPEGYGPLGVTMCAVP